MPPVARRPADRYLNFGLASRRTPAESRTAFHRHSEVEFFLVERGEITHLFGTGRLTLGPAQLAVFWGAVPHLPVAFSPGTRVHWLTVPLAWFLQWNLPAPFTSAILQGRVFRRRAGARGAAEDLAMFNRWHADLQSDRPERRHLVLLECEARLRRLLLDEHFSAGDQRRAARLRPADAGKVEAMAAFIARHYTEPLTADAIAQDVKLHPDYAGALFRRTCGATLLDYVTAMRLSHAQRLLTTTDEKIISVAFAAGFGSASRFYAVFLEKCGLTPRAYRSALRAKGRPTRRKDARGQD